MDNFANINLTLLNYEKLKILHGVFIIMTSVVLLSGCASIVTKTSYPVRISSTPSNAKISVTDKNGIEVFSGHTPAIVSLSASSGFFSKATYMVEFTKANGQTESAQIVSTLDGWYFGNILIGGIIGMLIIDPATGAMWKIDTTNIHRDLDDNVTASKKEEGLMIMAISDVPDHLKEKLVEIK